MDDNPPLKGTWSGAREPLLLFFGPNCGATDNAGVENARASKMQGVENAGVENTAQVA